MRRGEDTVIWKRYTLRDHWRRTGRCIGVEESSCSVIIPFKGEHGGAFCMTMVINHGSGVSYSSISARSSAEWLVLEQLWVMSTHTAKGNLCNSHGTLEVIRVQHSISTLATKCCLQTMASLTVSGDVVSVLSVSSFSDANGA